MAGVKKGDAIRINYMGKLEDGTIFDSTEGGAPLEFKVGGGEFLADLENGVIGMSTGEIKVIHIPAERAYGLRKEERVFEYDRQRLPEGFKPEIGQQFQMYRADGFPITVIIVGISETSVRTDCNHPLAGKNLTFHITLEGIL